MLYWEEEWYLNMPMRFEEAAKTLESLPLGFFLDMQGLTRMQE
jgi:hypothetical protein